MSGLRPYIAVLMLMLSCGSAFSQAKAARIIPAPGGVVGPTIRLRQQVIAPSPSTDDHALFVTSYIGEEDRIVARTRYGNISASDFYLWLTLRDSSVQPYLLQMYDMARTKSERDHLAAQLKQEINEYVFTNYVIPELMGNKPCDETAAWKAYLYTLPAWQLAYIKQIIEPLVCVYPSDREKYLRDHKSEIAAPPRWKVQYIFLNSTEEDPIEQQDEAETLLLDIREKALAGEVDFSQAAREHSQAPSASNGGEIPAFGRGQLFFMMENAVSNLQPGEISEPFRGPKGLYLVKLLEVIPGEEPSLENHAHWVKTEEGVTRQILRATYRYENVQLFIRRPAVYQHVTWDERRDCDTVGVLCDFQITKQQFRDIFPNIEDEPGLTRRDDLINSYIHGLMEREAMAQELRESGLGDLPLLRRARWMAENMTQRDGYIDKLYGELKVSESLVKEFWRENPALFTPMAMKRVVRLTLTAANAAPTQKDILDELVTVLNGGEPAEDETADAEFSEGFEGDTFVIDDEATTDSLPPVAAPSLAPGGGSSTIPAAGGSDSPGEVDEAPESASDRRKVASVASSSGVVLNRGPKPPAPAPMTSYDPLHVHGIPVVEYDETPSMYNPPPVGVVRRGDTTPFNPDWHYHKMQPSRFREIIKTYSSSDYVMRYEDLGFVYIEDRPEIPPQVNAVPVGGFSEPVIAGTGAVTYYIEDARGMEKPSFEAIKTHAYSVYRSVQVDKKLQRVFNDRVKSANIVLNLGKVSAGEK